MVRRLWIAPLLCIALVAAACSVGADSDEATSSTTEATTTTVDESTTTAPATTEAAEDVDLLDDAMALDSALALSIEILEGRELTQPEFEAVFSEPFKQRVPFPVFNLSTAQIRSEGPWTIGDELGREETGAAISIVNEEGKSWFLAVEVAAVDDATIMSLEAAPLPEVAEVAGFDEGAAQLQELGTLRLATFETTGDTCEVVNAVGADEQMPLGSIFKLYVLGAVVDAIEAGDVAWDDEVPVRDELDSIPSGTTQDEEPGTLLTVRELADRMISISDNTATDHLIDLVGREAVEAAVANYGHSAPELNRPFLTTREFTILKFGTDDDVIAEFGAADEAGRRALIDDLPTELPSVLTIVGTTDPVEVETIEWFASPSDICRVFVQLGADPVAREVISLNPGWPDDNELFSFVGFKGGSEPGVLAMAWVVDTADGQSFVVAGGVANEDAVVDEGTALGLFVAVRDGVIGG